MGKRQEAEAQGKGHQRQHDRQTDPRPPRRGPPPPFPAARRHRDLRRLVLLRPCVLHPGQSPAFPTLPRHGRAGCLPLSLTEDN